MSSSTAPQVMALNIYEWSGESQASASPKQRVLRLHLLQTVNQSGRANVSYHLIDQKLRQSPTSSSPPSHPPPKPKTTTYTRTILKGTTPMARTLPLLFLSPAPVRYIRVLGNKKIKIPKKHTTLRSARALQKLPKHSSQELFALRQTMLMSTI